MLKPRYSLLTLLILTALIAGGVKWWHGPHRMVFELPFPATLLTENKSTLVLVEDCFVTYEYEYTGSWSGRRIHYHAARAKPNAYLSPMNEEDSRGRPVWSVNLDQRPAEFQNPTRGDEERVTFWIAPPREISPAPAAGQLPIEREESGLSPFYGITDRQRIVKEVVLDKNTRFYFLIVKIDLSEIPFPLVRERIHEELAAQKQNCLNP